MASVKLTDDFVNSLPASTSQVEYYDYSFTAGGSFGVRVTPPRGTKSFFVIYSINRRRKRMTLGRYPVLSLDKAKARAYEIIRQAQAGQDPAAQSRLHGRPALAVAAPGLEGDPPCRYHHHRQRRLERSVRR